MYTLPWHRSNASYASFTRASQSPFDVKESDAFKEALLQRSRVHATRPIQLSAAVARRSLTAVRLKNKLHYIFSTSCYNVKWLLAFVRNVLFFGFSQKLGRTHCWKLFSLNVMLPPILVTMFCRAFVFLTCFDLSGSVWETIGFTRYIISEVEWSCRNFGVSFYHD